MNDATTPLPPQRAMLDEFDLELDICLDAQPRNNLLVEKAHTAASAAPAVQSNPAAQSNVVTISAIPVVDTPLGSSARDRAALDIPILTTLHTSQQAINPAVKPDYPVRSSKAS